MTYKLKKIIEDKYIYIFFIITMMFFGIFIKTEYATDTYCVVATDTSHYCKHFLYSGRPISALLLFVTRALGFGTDGIYFTSFAIAIICTVASMYILFNILKKDLKSEISSLIISILIIINLFVLIFRKRYINAIGAILHIGI